MKKIIKEVKLLLEYNESLFIERENDHKQRYLAYQILIQIKKYIELKKYKEITLKSKYDNVVISLNELHMNLDIVFSIRPPDECYAAYGDNEVTKNKMILINVGVNDRILELYYKKEYHKIINENELSLIHEIIHYLDDLRTEGKYRLSNNYKLNSYPNYPSEWNAYYQEVASHYDTIIKQIQQISDKNNRIQEFYKQIGRSPLDLIKRIVKDNDIKKNYKEQYYFKFVKRIYQLYYELFDLL
jgi:hypothetical protein